MGRFGLGKAFFRADRGPRAVSLLSFRALRRTDAWCDDPADRRYNQLIARSASLPAAVETMWRDDRLYDLVVEIAYNVRPRVRGRGSAIFIHRAKPGFQPTAGCVALQARDLRRLVGMIGRRTRIVIG